VQAGSDKKKDEAATKDFKKAYESFQLFIDAFESLQVPVKPNKSDDKPDLPDEIKDEMEVSDFLISLMDPLHAYREYLKENNYNNKEIHQKLIKRFSELSGGYYENLYETCTTQEKIILHDFVFDNISPVKDKQIVIDLHERGLLKKQDDNIEVMNVSFKEFLANRSSRKARKDLTKSLSDQNKWKGYKYAIWLVIIALFVFLLLSNQEYFGNLDKLIGAVTVSIGGLTKLMDKFYGQVGKISGT
jgi:hypothetical protein